MPGLIKIPKYSNVSITDLIQIKTRHHLTTNIIMHEFPLI